MEQTRNATRDEPNTTRRLMLENRAHDLTYCDSTFNLLTRPFTETIHTMSHSHTHAKAHAHSHNGHAHTSACEEDDCHTNHSHTAAATSTAAAPAAHTHQHHHSTTTGGKPAPCDYCASVKAYGAAKKAEERAAEMERRRRAGESKEELEDESEYETDDEDDPDKLVLPAQKVALPISKEALTVFTLGFAFLALKIMRSILIERTGGAPSST